LVDVNHWERSQVCLVG